MMMNKEVLLCIKECLDDDAKYHIMVSDSSLLISEIDKFGLVSKSFIVMITLTESEICLLNSSFGKISINICDPGLLDKILQIVKESRPIKILEL